MTGSLKPLGEIIQRCRSVCYRLVDRIDTQEERKLQEHLERHQYTLSPEVRIELERRCADQYGD